MSDSENKFDRRQFLQGGLIAGGSFLTPTPIERLLNVMANGFIRQAHAETVAGEGIRNYVNVMMIGAPYRYAFDHWIAPNKSDPTPAFNPMVATKFVNSNGRASGVTYSTFEYNGVMVPHMFSHTVFTSANANRPLTDLLKNMLVIRGYGSGLDGHPFNASAQQTPVGGVSSIGGLAADSSTKTFEAVQWPDRGDFGNFVSLHGKAMNKLTGSPLLNLMQGFAAPDPGRVAGRNVKTRNIAAYELAQARLSAYAKSDRSGSAVVKKNLDNAAKLMKAGVSDINSYWAPAVARYNQVILTSMRQSGLPGISDLGLFSQENALWKLHVASGNRGMVLSKDFDLRNSMSQTTGPGSWAESLALAEYVLTKGLVTSIDIQMGEVPGVMLQEQNTGGAVAHHLIHDMHESGGMAGLFYTTALFRAFAAGLLELTDKLKAAQVNGKDVWSETVVQLMSDFGRSARSDGSGSDHGFNQMVTSVFSGAFTNGPHCVGNIYQSGPGGGYQGTQGLGAPIDGYNQNGRPTPTMAASTVAELLRAPKNPYQNLAKPLASLTGEKLIINFPAKTVNS
ncbi:DUF1501 domain-containing protein [Bdellovibrio sp. NC01]|uniref:DUF1501 domain-containing protein n=1 Tax=Bdellovibrio sp. NC01 TaxID=2220073 RepID=UPI001159BA97|nr:DUF1501 domain-containing protein [Bdellovibrio sp. NC01]QDK39077.1 hypothetical protein DOE51_16520 [Bdellovibrio sp. NC01]